MYILFRNETVAEGCGQNSAWKDQLKSYNGTPITYDALGNPLNYLGKVMTWQGRKLTSIDGVAMEYDYNGLRVRKGDKTYYWQGGNLVMERWVKNDTENYIYYYYDESGVCGMCYNGSEYYYRKNIFGDVIEIYNNIGTLQCRYVYDAWGNHKVYNASGSEIGVEVANIGNVNPIRYRGYYWDKEFGLYYLQSRYYDPLLGRFISADSVEYLEPESVNGLNLYTYCGNNPVMYTDPEGNFLISTAVLIGAIIGGIIGAGVGVGVVAYQDYKDDGELFNGSKKWYEYLGAALIGGAVGAAIGAGVGYAAGYLAGGTYANGLVAKSVTKGVKTFFSQQNKVHKLLKLSRHNLSGYTSKTAAKLMKRTLSKGVFEAYKSVQSMYLASMNSQVTYVIINGIIAISDMWIKSGG